MAGKKTDESFVRGRPRRASLVARVELGWNARSRLKAWTIAMPASDSAICAVSAAIRVRTSLNASCERRWNQRVTTMPGGSTTRATSPRRQSSTNRPTTAAQSTSTFETRVASPWDRTSDSASTSLVSRAMIQPARCSEK